MLRKRIKRAIRAGCVLITLLFCASVYGYDSQLEPLYQQYSGLDLNQLIKNYDEVVALHYKLRDKRIMELYNSIADLESRSESGGEQSSIAASLSEVDKFINTDNKWIEQRNKAYRLAVFNRNCPALIHVIVLQNLRNGVLLEKNP